MAKAMPLATYKLVFVGDHSVGKTCIINRFMFEKFNDAYQPTLALDFLTKTMYLEDRNIRLQVWDTAGLERYESLIPSYIRDSYVAVIVYDVTSRSSFTSTAKWVTDVRRDRGSDGIIMLVGNKTDLVDKRKVSLEEGAAKAKELNTLFLETSAKAGSNIEDLFLKVAAALTGVGVQSLAEQPVLVDVTPNPMESTGHGEKKSGGCTC